MDKYVSCIFAFTLSHSLSLSLARCCVTADVLVIREKVGISFARLIPEVSSRERQRGKQREGGKGYRIS